MIKNYLKVAVRNIIRHKGFSTINIVGLAIGIACSVLILLFVAHELSYDKFHEKADRIYRLAVRASVGDSKIHQTYSSSMTFKRLLADFLEIETGVKFLNLGLFAGGIPCKGRFQQLFSPHSHHLFFD